MDMAQCKTAQLPKGIFMLLTPSVHTRHRFVYCRTSFVFDALNVPAVINENAVQTLLLNQDRCTKNFLVYYNPDTKEWIRCADSYVLRYDYVIGNALR